MNTRQNSEFISILEIATEIKPFELFSRIEIFTVFFGIINRMRQKEPMELFDEAYFVSNNLRPWIIYVFQFYPFSPVL